MEMQTDTGKPKKSHITPLAQVLAGKTRLFSCLESSFVQKQETPLIYKEPPEREKVRRKMLSVPERRRTHKIHVSRRFRLNRHRQGFRLASQSRFAERRAQYVTTEHSVRNFIGLDRNFSLIGIGPGCAHPIAEGALRYLFEWFSEYGHYGVSR
jgi:hypothetical protein